MNQTWKIIVAVIITAVVVGGGFYFWQQSQKPEPPQVAQKIEGTQKIVLYSDNIYTFKFVANKQCGSYFSVKEGADFIDEKASRLYTVFASGSKDKYWDSKNPLMYYGVYSKDKYDQLIKNWSIEEPSGQTPQIVLTLKSNLFLVKFLPQTEGPADLLEGCDGVVPEKL